MKKRKKKEKNQIFYKKSSFSLFFHESFRIQTLIFDFWFGDVDSFKDKERRWESGCDVVAPSISSGRHFQKRSGLLHFGIFKPRAFPIPSTPFCHSNSYHFHPCTLCLSFFQPLPRNVFFRSTFRVAKRSLILLRSCTRWGILR